MQKKHPYPGTYIVFEGIDGSGKTTLAQSLAENLSEDLSCKVLLTKEPGGTPLGKTLRTMLQDRTLHLSPKAEFLLFAADRSEHFSQIVIPGLKEKKIIISDRSSLSSTAYQGYGRDLSIETLNIVNQWATESVYPDLIFYIKIDINTAIERMKARAETTTRFEEKISFLEKVIDGYEKILKDTPNVHIINGKNDLKTIAREIYKLVKLHGEKE